MKLGVDVVGAVPRLVDLGIGADHVVVGQHVLEAEVLHPLGVGPDGADRGADLGLGQDDADTHHVAPGVVAGGAARRAHGIGRAHETGRGGPPRE